MIHDLIKAVQNAVAALLRALSIFAAGFETMFVNFVTNGVKGAIIAWTPIVTALEGALLPIVNTVVNAIRAQGPGIGAAVRKPFSDVVNAWFTASGDALRTRGESTPDNALAQAGDAMADAFGNGIASHSIAMAFEALFP